MEKKIKEIPSIKELEDLRKKINSIKSNTKLSLKTVNNELTNVFVYNSNLIAGDKISKEGTARIIKGEKNNNITQKAKLDILGLNAAYSRMLEIAAEPKLTVEHLAELHTILQKDIDSNTAGIIRPNSSNIDFKNEIRKFVTWFNNNALDTFDFAAEAYSKFIYMHPFKGSNGRLARLVLNIVFAKKEYNTVIIPYKWHSEYETLLKDYNTEIFSNFLKKCVYFSQNLVVNKQGNIYSVSKKRHIRGLDISNDVLDIITEKPGIKSTELKKSFPKISFTKLQRVIRSLATSGKIEFRGATKTGGYYIIETPAIQ